MSMEAFEDIQFESEIYLKLKEAEQEADMTSKRYSSKEVLSSMREYIDDDLLIHPGETIGDVLEERDITQDELAARTGTSLAYVVEIISGKRDISDDFALALEHALGVPASFWMNLQANYDKEKKRTARGS